MAPRPGGLQKLAVWCSSGVLYEPREGFIALGAAQRQAARDASGRRSELPGLGFLLRLVLCFELGQVRQQFVFTGQAAEVEADHLVCPECRLTPGV